MNQIGNDCEKIIWDYYFSAINYEKKMEKLLFEKFDNEICYDNRKDNVQIYFLDFIDKYKRNKKKKNKIYFKLDLLNPNNKIIKDLDIVLQNKEKYNYPIKEIIKLKGSDILYILL